MLVNTANVKTIHVLLMEKRSRMFLKCQVCTRESIRWHRLAEELRFNALWGLRKSFWTCARTTLRMVSSCMKKEKKPNTVPFDMALSSVNTLHVS